MPFAKALDKKPCSVQEKPKTKGTFLLYMESSFFLSKPSFSIFFHAFGAKKVDSKHSPCRADSVYFFLDRRVRRVGREKNDSLCMKEMAPKQQCSMHSPYCSSH